MVESVTESEQESVRSEEEDPSLLVAMPLSQNLPARRSKESLDMYSAGKVSGNDIEDSDVGNADDDKSLEEWVRQRQGAVPQRIASISSCNNEMTYQGPGNITQVRDRAEFEEESNSEYNVDEVMEDGGDQF